MDIAQRKGDKCQNTSCKYCSKAGHLCRFGLRDIGCYIENDVVSGMADHFLKSVESGVG